MQAKLEKLKSEALVKIGAVKDKKGLADLENKFLGRKSGELTELLKGLRDLSEDMKKVVGPLANEVKAAVAQAISDKLQELSRRDWQAALEKERVDVTQPALPRKERGHWHPNTIVQHDLEDLFTSMGFMVLDGPELESDYYNFTAVNVPETHPARDMQDTFYIKGHKDWLMRTQTSPVQVRAMQKYGAPIRVIIPGRCFRNEALDVRHEHTFYQLEGLVVAEKITFADMKGVMQAAANHLFGPDTKVRLMPKFYPFVEPGVRGEITCFLCQGKGCQVCKGTGWLEVMPGGMVHPSVLQAGGVNPKKFQGFAFGFGLTRLVMLKYGITDVRLLQGSDLRFLKQF